jgi:delta14-sterol reductase
MDVATLSPRRRLAFDAGFAAMLVGLPALSWYLTLAVLHHDARLVVPDAAFWAQVAAPTARAVAFWCGWVAFQALLAAWLPGRTVRGMPLPDGGSLPYRLNGLLAFAVSLALAGALVASGALPATFLADEFEALLTTTNLLVPAGCFWLLWLGRRQASAAERRLNPLEAYIVGACRNPRLGRFDLKFFCEARPGMILWVLIDLSLAAKQLELHGSVSNAMLLVCAFQLLYVADYFWFEDAILSTWDIKHEPFGFMLCWGCLVWVPFTYCLQPLYLVEHPEPLPGWAVAAIAALGLVGFAIFRDANLQKHRFRSHPLRRIWGSEPEWIETEAGSRLLVSGWWGLARHANYLGDWLMGVAWSLSCGFERALPYFYPLYFAVLLVHRERRDARHCARKYGDDWQRYTARVRWRIVPGVY